MKNKNLKESKGITLIALVITIIVLLILAAVSIATLTGENGILTKAQTAKKETEEGQEEEQVRLAQAEANMNDKETEYAGIKIPAGMAPTRAEGESTVDEGLVAVDKNGNEWVWVEVPISKLNLEKDLTFDGEDSEDYNTLTTALKAYASPYTKGSATQSNSNTWKDEYYEKCGVGSKEDYDKIYHTMLKSIYENEGFWIGRYEAGIEGTTGVDEASLAKARTSSTDPIDFTKAICQKNAIPYNYVTVSQSQTLASAMSPDNSKTSSLIFGIQWDLTCKFIEEKEVAKQGEGKKEQIIASINSNSEEWGNYQNTHLDNLSSNAKGIIYSHKKVGDAFPFSFVKSWGPIETKLSCDENDSCNAFLSTGASEETKKLNIYDFAGNEFEWTLEQAIGHSDVPCVRRAGPNYAGGPHYPASYKLWTR